MMVTKKKSSDDTVSYKDTLNLPRTDFPIRAHAATEDPALLKRWQQESLYTKTFSSHKEAPSFILHDGPPYANGPIHLGTAYNKLLKDIVAKGQRMLGKHVPITPGWDCHGLPIEWNVTKEKPGLSRAELKKACRAYAQKWVEEQREQFKALGVLMDWEHPYLTMAPSYEAKTVEAFGILWEKGYIARKNKTVPWCPTCKTVLATAEIEYEERKDPSIYVRFALAEHDRHKLLVTLDSAAQAVVKDRPISLLVWTTTPWTLPLNRAVLVKPAAQYQLVDVDGVLIILGKELVDAVADALGHDKKILATFTAEQLAGFQVVHPFVADLNVPVIADASVEITEGTACVHCAPGCGPEDYEIALKNDLEVFSPISSDGRYTTGVKPDDLVDMSVKDGQIWVIKKLAELGALILKKSVRHSYPHCWRCHGPLIWRATKQWFCNLTKGDLKKKTLQATEDIPTIPVKGINRLRASIEGRLEWCLSRQRVWGAPIPALLCTACDATYISQEFIDHVVAGIARDGIDFWDTVSLQDLMPNGLTCSSCGGTQWKKELDILDVWFDSGVSHYAVLKDNPALRFPADMYLEAKDQTRGWFQSSLLTSMAIEGESPTKNIVIHGFTVDNKGRKMSKSLGNVVRPDELIKRLGTDGLRLWATTIDIGSDAVISETLVQNVQEVFRKIRNTARFLLSNLYDFDKERDAVPLDSLRLIDRHALERLFTVNHEIISHYQTYDIAAVFYALTNYCTVDLSSFYLDIIKDRLYVEQADGHARRSAQTVCWYILDALTRLIAPVLSFTAEHISDHYQEDKTESIHLQRFSQLERVWRFIAQEIEVPLIGIDMMAARGVNTKTLQEVGIMHYLAQQEILWNRLKAIRSEVLKAIEQVRATGDIKHSLEAAVTLYIDDLRIQELHGLWRILDETDQSKADFFKEILIVSQATIADTSDSLEESSIDGLFVRVERVQGEKCPRCWHWQETEHTHNLCGRCQKIVKNS